jgi:hypothetical protein
MRTFGWAMAVSLAAHIGFAAAMGLRAGGEDLGFALVELPEPEPVVVELVAIPQESAGAPRISTSENGGRQATRDPRHPAASQPEIGDRRPETGGRPETETATRDRRPAATGALAMRYREPIGRVEVPEVAAPERRDPRALPGLDFLGPKTPALKAGPSVAPSPKSRADLGPTVARRDTHGRERFRDRRNFRIRLAIPSRRELGAMIDNWLADPEGTALAATADPLDEYHDRKSRSGGASDSANAKNTFIAPIAGGGFDITDAFMRASGADPYASKKLDHLDRTRDERAQIAATRKVVDLDDSIVELRGHLERIWRRRDLSPKQRRAILFELWDECAESGSENDLRAATLARATIAGFIRRNLPRGSKHGYTDAELAELNRGRASRRRFEPYAIAR